MNPWIGSLSSTENKNKNKAVINSFNPTLKKLKQVYQKYRIILGYTISPMSAWDV